MRKIRGDKGAQGLSLTTIILIVLGIVVLALLVWGFSTGWSNLWEKINIFGGGEVNVDTVKQACILACNTNAINKYCVAKQNINGLNSNQVNSAIGAINSTLHFNESKKEIQNKTNGKVSDYSVSGKKDAWKIGFATCENLKEAGIFSFECKISCPDA